MKNDNILPPPSMQKAGLFPERDILLPSYLSKEDEKGSKKSFQIMRRISNSHEQSLHSVLAIY